MGLKTTNYEVHNLGITLPEAYAKIREMRLRKDNVVDVTFVVQTTRENTERLAPIETRSIHFTWDRKSDLAETAYAEAKKREEYKSRDPQTGKEVTLYNDAPFYGWTDDIVKGQLAEG